MGEQKVLADIPRCRRIPQRRPISPGRRPCCARRTPILGAAARRFFRHQPHRRLARQRDLGGLFGGGSQAWASWPSITVPIFRRRRAAGEPRCREHPQGHRHRAYEKGDPGRLRESPTGSPRAAPTTSSSPRRSATRRAAAQPGLAQFSLWNGIDSYLNVLTAQTGPVRRPQTLVATRAAALIESGGLYRALGGGWIERTAGRRALANDGRWQAARCAGVRIAS